MELAAKRFARWVLIIHLLLLAAVMGLVYSAAARTYRASREHAIQQASKVQMLLAEQTQRGIEAYYSSIAETIELLHSQDIDASGMQLGSVTANIIAPAIWEQLKNRASHFVGVSHRLGRVGIVFPASDREAVEQVIQQNMEWLRTTQRRSISRVVKMGDQDVNLVATTGPRGLLTLVAVVPLANIEKQFLMNVTTSEMGAMIFDSDMRIISAFDKKLVGLSMVDEGEGNQNIRRLARQYVETGTAGTEVVERPFTMASHQFDRGMVSIRPMQVLDRRFWLTISSDLSSVESVLQTTFRESLDWGIFLVVSMMAILASTSAWLIRSRVRVERMRTEVIRRELDDARKIQLAWLPRNDQDPPHVDLNAVNEPASHISGDFYNWFDLDDGRVCIVIGDVTGHGMAAAFLMATTQLLTRIIMPRSPDAGRCLEAVNHQLCKQVFSGQFVTMQLIILDRNRAQMEIASAGHPPPLIRRSGRFEPVAVEPQLVLGIEQGQKYTSQIFPLPGDAVMLMYTDGVIEARSPAGEWMGIDGLCDRLGASSTTSEGLSQQVIQIVDQFRKPLELADDLTLVAIRVSGNPLPLKRTASELMNDPRG